MGISRILGCLLGCHILFIPFSLPVNALTAYDSAANLSSSWINNGSRDIGVDSEDYSTLRPIFLGQGINASFACGFYCNYNCEGYLFAILIFPPPGKYNYPEVRNPKVVWSANQNFLVRDDATLQLTQDGDLILRDADGTLVWCTYTYGKSVVGLNLTETGNLVLFDSNNASVWQSFDHPTDSLVPGQILVLGQKLIATVSNKDWSQGLISLVVTEYGQCFCPGPTAGETRYFTPVNDEEPDLGCKEITPLSCNASHYQSLLMLRSTTSALILQLNKTEIGNETESDIESCKQACLSNFSCKAAVFLSGVENGGACYLLSEIFSLMKDAPFVGLVFIVIIIGRYLILKGKDVKEDGEDKDLLQVPGMPTRFSHEILVAATENFSRELGKGGFGSVFEGILTDGTKVAVKCINDQMLDLVDKYSEDMQLHGEEAVELMMLAAWCLQNDNDNLDYNFLNSSGLGATEAVHRREINVGFASPVQCNIILTHKIRSIYIHIDDNKKMYIDNETSTLTYIDNFGTLIYDHGYSWVLMTRTRINCIKKV
ncbi:unnamed protein product, partial [Vitis vinifera]